MAIGTAAPDVVLTADRNVLVRSAQSLGGLLRLLARRPSGLIGLILVAFFVLLSALGPLFVPGNLQPDVTAIYAAPSLAHPLGTDSQGRDVLDQVLLGGRTLLVIAVIAAGFSTLIAVTLGALAAFLGGVVDAVIVALTDMWLTIPQFPLLAVLAGLIHFTNPSFMAVIIGLLTWPSLTRAVRAQVLSLRQRDYVEAARALDLGTRRIIFSEILPNMMAYIAINFSLGMVAAIYFQSALYFLGFAPLAGNNWGIMINLAWVQGAIFYQQSIWYILAPVAAIALFSVGLVTLTRALEEIFNPRLRGSLS